MKNYLFIPMMLMACLHLPAQSFLNGSFETNTASGDQININNSTFTSLVSNTTAFGLSQSLDLITSSDYCSPASSGAWYVGVSRGEQFSMELSSSLTAGETYTLNFYERYCTSNPAWTSSEIIFGLSSSPSSFGDTIHVTPPPVEGSSWTSRSFLFVAPTSGQYITIMLRATALSTWIQLDEFSITLGGISVDDAVEQTAGSVVPNPATDYFTLPAEANGTTVTVTDMQGKTVLEIPSYSLDMGDISIADLPAGLYLVQMTSDEGRHLVQRLLKAGL